MAKKSSRGSSAGASSKGRTRTPASTAAKKAASGTKKPAAKSPPAATISASDRLHRSIKTALAGRPLDVLPGLTEAWMGLLSVPAAQRWLQHLASLAPAALPTAAAPPTAAVVAPAVVVAPAAVVLPAVPAATPAASSDMLGTRLSPVDNSSAQSLRTLPIKIDTAMDPRLQLALANHQTGKSGLNLASTTGDEVAVIARVKSVEEWEALPDIFAGCNLGKTGDGSSIVTGRVPIQRIEAVRAEPTIVSLKASQPVGPTLSATIQSMLVSDQALPANAAPDGGRDVVIGIVDFGCDFAHRNFRDQNGNSRLLALWHQNGAARPDSPFGYGRKYTAAEIDAALPAPNPYTALGYGPAEALDGTHGTHVMDIAAGNGLGSTQAGVAPKAGIVFVEAATSDLASEGPATVNQAFGDSVQLLEAVRFIFDTAGDKPCVCNLSLGTNGGPHDGTSLVEQGLDAIVREKPNRAVVIAASNSQLHGIHTSGQVPAAGNHEIIWQQRSQGGGEFEMWYGGARRLEVTLVATDGTVFGPVQPGDNLSIGQTGAIAIFMSSRLSDPNNHDNVIGIWLAEGMPGDNFVVRLRSLDGQPVDYHAWIERNDFAQASFAAPVSTHTLGSISTGHETVVVGSYDGHKPAFPLSNFSSAGPTRDGRNKPELSAPGQNVMAAKSRTGTGIVRKSGTSMAAPAITGLIALIFAEARRNGRDLPISELRARLQSNATINPPAVPAGTWDGRYGFGRANGGSIQDTPV